MNANPLSNISNTDIFIIDQLLKGRFEKSQKILDAGCGIGRNLTWFYDHQFDIYGIDTNTEAIDFCKHRFPLNADQFTVHSVQEIPYSTHYFDVVICNAVLHFAKDASEFQLMFSELLRVLKPNGMLFIRVASLIGLQSYQQISEDIYTTLDGSTWLLVSEDDIASLIETNNLSKLEPVKTTVVENLRCMTTLVLKKN